MWIPYRELDVKSLHEVDLKNYRLSVKFIDSLFD